MSEIPVTVGDQVTFTKTVSESDVYLFAGLSGDLSPNHVDAAFMARTSLGQRVVHGALSVALMSGASAKMTNACQDKVGPTGLLPMNLGFDKIRFLKPVFFGDTLATTYTVVSLDYSKPTPRSVARIEMRNQRGEVTAIAEHLNAWVSPTT